MKPIIKEMLDNTLVFDIESSSMKNGVFLNIKNDFDEYVENAMVKWVGCYSYKYDKYYEFNALEQREDIISLFAEHETLVGFNSDNFDYVVMKNNKLLPYKRFSLLDVMLIIGDDNYREDFKKRGNYMNVDLKPVTVNGVLYGANSLQGMAHGFGLDVVKGEINYSVFNKNSWNSEEINNIIKYLRADVEITKKLFDILVDFWELFTDWLSDEDIKRWVWIKSTIASLTYVAACKVKSVTPTYGKRGDDEEMGGRAVEPSQDETFGAHYMDEVSKYPHIFSEFNLFSEVNVTNVSPEYVKAAVKKGLLFHGNEKFKVRGYYDIRKHGVSEQDIITKLKTRFAIKKVLKEYKKNGVREIVVPELLKDIIKGGVLTDEIINTLKGQEYAIKIYANCFTPETDIVMADNNVKKIRDCEIGEYVWSLNPKTLLAEKKKITRTYEYDWYNYIHNYSNHRVNLSVTPNHNFFITKTITVKNKKSEENVFIESCKINNRCVIPIHKKHQSKINDKIDLTDYLDKNKIKFCVTGINYHARLWLNKYNLPNDRINHYLSSTREYIYDWSEIKHCYKELKNDKRIRLRIYNKDRKLEYKIPYIYNIDDFSYLIGIYIAEGSLQHYKNKLYPSGNYRGDSYTVNIAQYKEVNPEICNKIITVLNNMNIKYSQGKQTFRISNSVLYNFILDNFGKLDYKHFLNKDFFHILNLEKVFEGLIDGDGNKRGRRFTTKYDNLKNDFIELCMRLGYTFIIRNDGCWRIQYKKTHTDIRSTGRKVEWYKGKVYCIEVEDNHIIMAGRKGNFNWVGQSLYGAVRNGVFEQISTPNAGYDCCWIGQQIHEYVHKHFESKGLKVIGGFTDSWFIEDNNISKDEIMKIANECMDDLKKYMPFPEETHQIGYETYIDYIVYHYDDKKKEYKKNNYAFISEGKVKIVGFPIKKNNASKLGLHIFKKYLEPEGIKNKRLKFSKSYIEQLIKQELAEDITLAAVTIRCNKASTYKSMSQLQAQISRGYLNGLSGDVDVIKNKKMGNAGLGNKYCTIKEAIDNGLNYNDLILDKVWNELDPFILNEKKNVNLSEWGL